MTYDELYEMWERDNTIDITNLSGESANIPKLHNKYYKLYVEQSLKLRKMKTDYSKLKKLKTEYYKGELDKAELDELGWTPQPLKILRQDIPSYLEADDDIIHQSLRLGMQEELVDYLEEIIKNINNRGFQIKGVIDWEKFKVGAI